MLKYFWLVKNNLVIVHKKNNKDMELKIEIIEGHMIPYNVISQKTKEIIPTLEKKYKNFTSPRETWEENLQSETFNFSFFLKESCGSSIEGRILINRNNIVLKGTIITPSFSEEIKFLFFKRRRREKMLEREIKRLKKLLTKHFFKSSLH